MYYNVLHIDSYELEKKSTKKKEKKLNLYTLHTQLHTDKHTPVHFSLFTWKINKIMKSAVKESYANLIYICSISYCASPTCCET